MLITAQATTNNHGDQLYAPNLDLANLKPETLGKKPDIWSVNVSNMYNLPLQQLIESPTLNHKQKHQKFNLLARHIKRKEGDNDQNIRFGSNGRTIEIKTDKRIYRAKGYNIYSKPNKRGRI